MIDLATQVSPRSQGKRSFSLIQIGRGRKQSQTSSARENAHGSRGAKTINKPIEALPDKGLGSSRAINLEHLLEHYRLTAQSEGKSPATIALVTSAVRYLGEFLRDNGIPTDIREIEPEQLRSFTRHLQGRERFPSHPFTKPQGGHLSGHTINAYLRSIRAFFSWAMAEGFIDKSPFSLLKIPKAPTKVIPALTEEQLVSLISAIDPASPQGPRDYAVVLLLADSGLRVSELTGLRVEDVDLGRRLLKVRGERCQGADGAIRRQGSASSATLF